MIIPKIISRGTVVASQDGTDQQSCCFASVYAMPTGHWIVVYRAAREKNSPLQQTRLIWSDDEGATWSESRAPFPDRRVNGTIGQFLGGACTALGGRRLVAVLGDGTLLDLFVTYYSGPHTDHTDIEWVRLSLAG